MGALLGFLEYLVPSVVEELNFGFAANEFIRGVFVDAGDVSRDEAGQDLSGRQWA
jgi:hypothetical protein